MTDYKQIFKSLFLSPDFKYTCEVSESVGSITVKILKKEFTESWSGYIDENIIWRRIMESIIKGGVESIDLYKSDNKGQAVKVFSAIEHRALKNPETVNELIYPRHTPRNKAGNDFEIL